LSNLQEKNDLANESLEEARTNGRDHLTQIELAVRAVCQARPDMTASEALAAVEMVRRLLSRNQAIF
jgi:hypothetical protein